MHKLRSQQGMALVVVLILSAVSLMIMTMLLYMITSGTQVSGMQKNYKTAVEAGLGGTDLVLKFIALQGEQTGQDSLRNTLNSFSLATEIPEYATCSGTNAAGAPYTSLRAKLLTSSTTWVGCLTSAPTPTSYDIKMQLGTTTKYNVYARIVDTVAGNSGSDEGLLKNGVVNSSGEVQVMSMPYIYTIEVDAENTSKTERAKFQVLYQY